MDYCIHKLDQERITRDQWSINDPRQISVGFLAWAYIFVFLQFLNVLRVSKVIGPLQISLSKMMLDTLQFLIIFSVILFAFSLALTELFWYYSTPEAGNLGCNPGNTTSCRLVFSSLGYSIGNLFWSLFGFLELAKVPFSSQMGFVYWDGIALLGAYHLVAIVILINMLIAMLTRSFELTSDNQVTEWKFHRTVVWISYAQLNFICPPPMNLIPKPHHIYDAIKRVLRWIAASVFHCDASGDKRQQRTEAEELHRQFREMELEAFYIEKNLRQRLSDQVEAVLVKRYKFGKLLKDLEHHQIY